MPCPHNEITIVQRSQRQSAVAAAAYQSGEKLFCEYDQQVKHYPEKRGKFRDFLGSGRAVARLSDAICTEHRLSVIADPKRGKNHYGKWLGNKAKPSHRELLCGLIDAALLQKPDGFDALLKLLRDAGCEVRRRGNTLSLRHPDKKGFVRLSSIDGYTEGDLRAVLAGEKEHTPRKKRTQATRKKNTLLIDIEAKLQAGKGGGYERWAKVFNVKQMAQTYNYLREHGLLDYGELEEKASAATEQFHALSAQIKAAETRMAEIAVLKTHIANYAKTRDVYAGYRKAGYSKKYLAEHESDILLHKAAKNAFDELGVKKLPTVKSLQEEYAKLLAEKKAAYAEYRRSRDEMRELLLHKQNVDRMLGKNEREEEKKKEHDRQYPSDSILFTAYGYTLHIRDELVADAFASLPEREQGILILYCVLELTDGEIGSIARMSRSSVQRHRTKALNELRKRLEDDGGRKAK